MKKIYLIIILTVACFDVSGQMQKVFSKYLNKDVRFGYNFDYSNKDTVILFALKKRYYYKELKDSISVSFFIKKNKKWKNILYHDFKYGWDVHSNYSDGRFVELVEDYNDCQCDILKIHRLDENKEFYISDTLHINYNSNAKIKLYKDWMIIATKKQIWFNPDFRIQIYIYHYENGK
ncbi:MAG TPA: hypothetical protein ENK91_06330, partial [Bacteroidetes bacterium]|nr:hypothetical protein [Bacteroidota bacterium]